MSSISNFLDTALSIDTQEGNAEQNYHYQKETLGEMYSEQKEQLKDAALQALPFGVAEASRAIHGVWETTNRIYAFKEKYSPQLEAFKAKASALYENIGKEGGEAIDYSALLKSGATKLGKQALELAAPEVLKRTGVDLNKALNASQGEGGLEAGLANLKEQGIDIATNKITRIAETGASRVREAIAPIARTVAQGKERMSNEESAIRARLEGVKRPAAEGAPNPIHGPEEIGIERAANTNVRALGESNVDIGAFNPVFEGAEAFTTHTEKLTAAINKASSSPNEAIRAAGQKSQGIIDTFRANKAQLEATYNETNAKLTEAQAKVERLQSEAPTVSELPQRAMYPAQRGKTPSVTQTRTNPELEAARAEVATHEATIEGLRTQASQLKSGVASSLGETQSSLRAAAGTAYDVGRGVLSAGGEALGIFGGVQAVEDLARGGNVGASQAVNDTTGIYFAGRSAQGIGSKAINLVKNNLGSALDKAKQITTEETNKTLAYEGKAPIKEGGPAPEGNKPVSVENKPTVTEGKVEVNPETVIKSAEVPVGNEAEVAASNLAKTGAEQLGKTLGVGLAEEGAEIGAAAAASSAIPVVGEAIDIGLGLYTAITAIRDLFTSPPKPPPPPPPQQQVVAVQHQQGVY